MRFQDIPQITRATYHVNWGWDYIEFSLQTFREYYELNLEPDFQRSHVWDREQQVKYVEHVLRNGPSGRAIYFNAPNFQSNKSIGKPMILVDGLQRLTSVRKFMNNQLQAFGLYHREFEGRMSHQVNFDVYINDLTERKDVLQWYLDLNSGVAHTSDELERVQGLLELC